MLLYGQFFNELVLTNMMVISPVDCFDTLSYLFSPDLLYLLP